MVGLALILAFLTMPAETVQTPAPAFEVVSVKPNKSGSGSTRVSNVLGGRFIATNVSLKQLIVTAYDVRDFQISGGPSWLGSEKYDIEARPESNPDGPIHNRTEEQRKAEMDHYRLMMQALLADRFKLTVHKESKEGTIYALVVAKNGLKIKELPPDAPTAGSTHTRGGELSAQGIKLSSLVLSLSGEVGHPIVDKTGLKGNYDIELKWATEESQSDGPSLFTALQDQLGLRLEPQKGPVEVIVVDHAEKASEN
jgi:uncharacterized protein (TIGR03435 family)